MHSDRIKATIYDVAARAGVAISTVSRVLNDSHDVSDATRRRVLDAIDALNFRPDRTAKSLAQKQTKSICVALPSFTTPFHTELLKGVRSRLRDVDMDLLLCDLGSERPLETLQSFLKRGTVDGLLLAGMEVTPSLAAELTALSAPVVLVGHAYDSFDAFVWDDEHGARIATDYLTGLGHRRIGFIKSSSHSPLMEGRLRGFYAGLAAAGLSPDPALEVAGVTEKHAGFSEEAGCEALKHLLDTSPDVTAIFCCSDVQAIGALLAAREAGRKVPEALSIVGYDDVKVTRYIGLTSVDQKMHDVGAHATDVLIGRIQGTLTGPATVSTIVPELRIRHSSAPPRA